MRSPLLHSEEAPQGPVCPCTQEHQPAGSRQPGLAPQLPLLPWSFGPVQKFPAVRTNQGMQDKTEHVAKKSGHHGINEQVLMNTPCSLDREAPH